MFNQPISPQPTMLSIGFGKLWQREWQVKQHSVVEWLYPLVLFLLIITLFPLAAGTAPNFLKSIAVPAVWIAALLSLLMGMENLFKPAVANGTLAQLVAAKVPLALWVLVKLLIHWLSSAGIVAVLSLLAVPLFGLTWADAGMLMVSILVGSPLLLLLAAIASALTVSLKTGAVLVPLIALPLQLPVLIFATGAVDLYRTGMNALPIVALLLAGSIIAVLVVPWVIALILKLAWTN